MRVFRWGGGGGGGGGGWKESGREKRTKETTKGEKHKSVNSKQYSNQTFCLTWNKHTLFRGHKPV